MQGEPLTEGKAAYESWLYWWFSGFGDLSQSIYPDTYPDNATWIGDLQIYTRRYLDQLIDKDSAWFQVPVLAFSLSDEDAAWIYGFSFHDPVLGRPATYSLTTAIERYYIGYGLTTTTVHEFGHNLGLDHPHDVPGQGGVPRGDDYYMWTGSESNSMMSYIDTNWDFGQFDQDNSARGMTATYLNEANLLLGEMSGIRLTRRVRGLLLLGRRPSDCRPGQLPSDALSPGGDSGVDRLLPGAQGRAPVGSGPRDLPVRHAEEIRRRPRSLVPCPT